MKPLRAWLLVATLPAVGCAFFGKSDAFVSRYFTPESATAIADPAPPIGLELRLGRVNAATHIKDKIVFRDSTYEIGYYEEKLWTENPEVYVRRALTRALFDRRGVRQIEFGAGTTLNVDIVAFEEVLAPTHVGRVKLTYALIDDRVVRLARAIVVERPIGAATGDAAARAMVEGIAAALLAAVDALADQIVVELRLESVASVSDGATRTP